MTLAEAIAEIENTNPAYNNPGAISGTGDTGTSFGAGIGIYSTLEAGKAALNHQVNRILSGESPLYPPSMTLDEMGYRYSTDPNYGNLLSEKLGVPKTTTLAELSKQNGIWDTVKKN